MEVILRLTLVAAEAIDKGKKPFGVYIASEGTTIFKGYCDHELASEMSEYIGQKVDFVYRLYADKNLRPQLGLEGIKGLE